MFLMYADESGDNGLPSQGSPTRYYCLSGVVIHELRWGDAIGALTTFRRWIKRRYGVYLEDELHHAEMTGKVKSLSDSLKVLKKHERLAIVRHHADELAKLTDISVINVVVDKASGKLLDKDAIFRGAWYRLFQRFENTIQQGNFAGPKNMSERGIVFTDSTDSNRLKTYLNRMRVRNPIRIPGHAGGSYNYNDRPIRTLIEDPIARESHQSYFIQAADCVAFLLKQFIDPSGYMKKHGGNAYFLRLNPILCKVASYSDPFGIVRL